MWTYMHVITFIPTLIVCGILAIIIGKCLKNASEKVRMIPIHIITFLLVMLEVIKQVKSIIIGYDFSHLPLHYCSLFAILYLLISFSRGNLRNSFRILAMVSGLTLLLVMMVMPDIVYSEACIKGMFNDYFCFHTVVFHCLALFGMFLLIFLRFFRIDFKKGLICTVIFYTGYCIIAASMSNLLKVNYNHFYYSLVDVIENLRLIFIDKLGYVCGQLLYVFCDSLTTIGFSVLMYCLFVLMVQLYRKLKNIWLKRK